MHQFYDYSESSGSHIQLLSIVVFVMVGFTLL